MSNKKELFIARLNIAQVKIMGLVEEVATGLDIESEEGQDRVADRFNTISFNLEEAYDTVILEEQVEEEVTRETLDEFIDKIVDMFDYEGVAQDVFRINFAGAIDRLKSRYGYCEFGGGVNGEIVTLTLRVDSKTVTVTRGTESYVHYLLVEEELVAEDESDDDCEECEDEESYQYEDEEEEDGRCDCPMCAGSWMEEEEDDDDDDVYSEVNQRLSFIEGDIKELKESIEGHLGDKPLGTASNLSEDDYSLISTYLIHVVEADKHEVLELSERGLMAAWNYHLYIKNNQ